MVALTLPTIAEGCVPTTTTPRICALGGALPDLCASGDISGTYYVDVDCSFFWTGPGPECILSLWIYEESNGRPGLQRWDEVVDNTCGAIIDGDTIIF